VKIAEIYNQERTTALRKGSPGLNISYGTSYWRLKEIKRLPSYHRKSPAKKYDGQISTTWVIQSNYLMYEPSCTIVSN